MTTQELEPLKTRLTKTAKIPEPAVNKMLAYIQGELTKESRKDKKPVTSNDSGQLYTMIVKHYNLGLLVDGVNVVITGQNMAMITFHGYKNKVLAEYPETELDLQLVRKGDEFSVGKESGSVVYTHQLADPFASSEAEIVGAYVVIKNKRGEYIETLNKTDYDKMKNASKQKYLWDQWASEFWLKSVLKRAFKRHFYDTVADIDREDNQQYGGVDVEEVIEKHDAEVEKVIKQLEATKTEAELKEYFLGLNKKLRLNPQVENVKNAMKAKFGLNNLASQGKAEKPEVAKNDN